MYFPAQSYTFGSHNLFLRMASCSGKKNLTPKNDSKKRDESEQAIIHKNHVIICIVVVKINLHRNPKCSFNFHTTKYLSTYHMNSLAMQNFEEFAIKFNMEW